MSEAGVYWHQHPGRGTRGPHLVRVGEGGEEHALPPGAARFPPRPQQVCPGEGAASHHTHAYPPRLATARSPPEPVDRRRQHLRDGGSRASNGGQKVVVVVVMIFLWW